MGGVNSYDFALVSSGSDVRPAVKPWIVVPSSRLVGWLYEDKAYSVRAENIYSNAYCRIQNFDRQNENQSGNINVISCLRN